MNTNKQLILLKKNSFFYLFLKNMIPTLSLISIFSPFIPIMTGFFRIKYPRTARICFSFWLYKCGSTYGNKSGASGIMQAFNVENVHGEDTYIDLKMLEPNIE